MEKLKEHILSRFESVKNYSKEELLSALFIPDTGAKNILRVIADSLLDYLIGKDYIETYENSNIQIKTVMVESNNKIKESMSFSLFRYSEFQTIDWEDSDCYKTFSEKEFMFFIFHRDEKNNEVRLNRIVFWKMNDLDLAECKRVWSETRKRILEAPKPDNQTQIIDLDFPAKKESPVMHVRPHARNKNDTLPLPNGGLMTKRSFWLNNTYIAEIIKERED